MQKRGKQASLSRRNSEYKGLSEKRGFCLRNNIDVLPMLIDNQELFLYDLINTGFIHDYLSFDLNFQ